MASIRNVKRTLRKQMKSILRDLPSEAREQQSSFIVQNVLQADYYKRAKSISLYLHMDDEVRTKAILQDALMTKRCYIPRYFEDKQKPMDMVLIRDLEDYEALPETKWGIKQPHESEDRPEALDHPDGLDLILVPGLAFTKRGARLGRGKGYYDSYLSRCGANTRFVGLAFQEQVLDDIPTQEHDVTLHDVVTPSKPK